MSMRLFFVAILSSCIGCATLVGGGGQRVSIDSNVHGADVIFNGVLVGRTPFNGVVKRSESGQVEIRMRGYRRVVTTFGSSIRPLFFGNIISGGFFGSSTDYGTGAMYEYRPNTYFAELRREEQRSGANLWGRDGLNRQELSQGHQVSEIRLFVLMNYEQLSNDVARGTGEYIATLGELLGLSESRRPMLISKLRAIAKQNPTPLEFSEDVLKLARTRPHNQTVTLR